MNAAAGGQTCSCSLEVVAGGQEVVLLVLLVGGQGVVHLHHLCLNQILAYNSVIIDEVSDRLLETSFSSGTALSLDHFDTNFIHVIILLHVGSNLPPDVGVKTCRILLHNHNKDSLLLEGGVQGEHTHQQEVSTHTSDQDGLRLGEGEEEVPDECKGSNKDSQGTDEQSSISQAVVLSVGKLLSHHLSNSIIKSILNRNSIPLVNLDNFGAGASIFTCLFTHRKSLVEVNQANLAW